MLPEEPVFFTDRDLGKKFPAKLKEHGFQVERHIDHFVHNAPDEEWLQEVGKRGWYVLTHDQRIRYKPSEKNAVLTYNIGMFIIIGKAPLPELADNVIATQTKILEFIDQHSRPFIAKIYRPPNGKSGSGRVDWWFPPRK